MKNVRLLSFLFAVFCAALLPACSGDTALDEDIDPDEAFLQDVRQRAALRSDPKIETGMLNPHDKNPRIEVETTDFDMGTITYEGLAHAELKIYNRGEGDLQISRITTTCGCTVGKMRQDVIKPGAMGILEITVDPTMIAGFSTTKTLTLTTNDPASPMLAINVTTHIAPQADLLPDSFVLGTIARGEGANVEGLVRQNRPESLVVDAAVIYPDSRWFSAGFEEVPESEWQSPGIHEFRVTGSLSPDAPPGTYLKVIMIHTNLPDQANIAIPFEVTVGQ